MKDILVINMNAGFSIASICLCLSMLFSFFLKSRGKKLEEKNKYFILDLCSIISMSIVEVIYVYIFTKTGVDSLYSKSLYLVYSIAILFTTEFSWMYVITYRLNLNEDNNKTKKYILFSIITIIELIIGFMIFTMPVKIYTHYGFFNFESFPFKVTVAYTLISTTMFVFLLYSKNKTLTKRDLYPSAAALVAVVLLLVFRVLTGIDINVETFQLTIFALGIFFTIENQDYKLLEVARQKQEAAEKANASQEEFLSNISHEIRSPMNTILGISQLQLENESLSSESIQDDMKKIKDTSQSLLLLINTITDYSELITNKNETIENEYYLNDMLSEINEKITNRVSKDVKYVYNVSENIPSTLIGDYKKISKILHNILNNVIFHAHAKEVFMEVTGSKKDDNSFQVEFTIKAPGTTIRKDEFDIDSVDIMEFGHEDKINSDILGLLIAKNLSKQINGELKFLNDKNTLIVDQKIARATPTKENEPAVEGGVANV